MSEYTHTCLRLVSRSMELSQKTERKSSKIYSKIVLVTIEPVSGADVTVPTKTLDSRPFDFASHYAPNDGASQGKQGSTFAGMTFHRSKLNAILDCMPLQPGFYPMLGLLSSVQQSFKLSDV